MRSYRVSFYVKQMNEKTGNEELAYAGSQVVDMKPNDPLTLTAKAFRRATPLQQMAVNTKVFDLGPWGQQGMTNG